MGEKTVRAQCGQKRKKAVSGLKVHQNVGCGHLDDFLRLGFYGLLCLMVAAIHNLTASFLIEKRFDF